MTVFFIILLFKFRAKKIKEARDKAHNYWPQIIGIINGIQIKIMSFIYSKLMEFFINWENHEKQSQFDNELTIKVVFYEFVNHYVSLFYIAFFKV